MHSKPSMKTIYAVVHKLYIGYFLFKLDSDQWLNMGTEQKELLISKICFFYNHIPVERIYNKIVNLSCCLSVSKGVFPFKATNELPFYHLTYFVLSSKLEKKCSLFQFKVKERHFDNGIRVA